MLRVKCITLNVYIRKGLKPIIQTFILRNKKNKSKHKEGNNKCKRSQWNIKHKCDRENQ